MKKLSIFCILLCAVLLYGCGKESIDTTKDTTISMQNHTVNNKDVFEKIKYCKTLSDSENQTKYLYIRHFYSYKTDFCIKEEIEYDENGLILTKSLSDDRTTKNLAYFMKDMTESGDININFLERYNDTVREYEKTP